MKHDAKDSKDAGFARAFDIDGVKAKAPSAKAPITVWVEVGVKEDFDELQFETRRMYNKYIIEEVSAAIRRDAERLRAKRADGDQR